MRKQLEKIFRNSGWSKQCFYGEKIYCRNCNSIAEEDIGYAATSTGRRFRCKKCGIETSFDETTEHYNPKKWKYFIDNFSFKKL